MKIMKTVWAMEANEEINDEKVIELNQEIDHGLLAIQEQQHQYDSLDDQTEEASSVADVLATMGDHISQSVDLSTHEAQTINVAVEHFCKRLSYRKLPTISLESYSSPKIAVSVALEGLGSFINSIWEAIKAAFNKLLSWIKGIWNAIFGIKEKVDTKLEAAQAANKKVTITVAKANLKEAEIIENIEAASATPIQLTPNSPDRSAVVVEQSAPVQVPEAKKQPNQEHLDRQEVFSSAFEKARKIEFKVEWKNGTGYFDGAAEGKYAPRVTSGQALSFVDDNKRRGIIVGSRFGNIVVFERYSPDGDNRSNTFVCNTTRKVKNEVPHVYLEQGLDTLILKTVLGHDGKENLGKIIGTSRMVDLPQNRKKYAEIAKGALYFLENEKFKKYFRKEDGSRCYTPEEIEDRFGAYLNKARVEVDGYREEYFQILLDSITQYRAYLDSETKEIGAINGDDVVAWSATKSVIPTVRGKDRVSNDKHDFKYILPFDKYLNITSISITDRFDDSKKVILGLEEFPALNDPKNSRIYLATMNVRENILRHASSLKKDLDAVRNKAMVDKIEKEMELLLSSMEKEIGLLRSKIEDAQTTEEQKEQYTNKVNDISKKASHLRISVSHACSTALLLDKFYLEMVNNTAEYVDGSAKLILKVLKEYD